MATRLKIVFVNAVIVLGAMAIIWVQWPEAMKSRGYGYAAYEQGLASRVFLAVLLTGIPVLLYAVAVHVALGHFLFKPGELTLHRSRKLVESIGGKDATDGAPAPHDDAAHNSLN
jgi:hypothetical protein